MAKYLDSPHKYYNRNIKERCISIKYVSVVHPRANGQVEQANDMILDALKKRLYEKDQKHLGKWLKEQPAVV